MPLFIDQLGRTIILPQPPRRIISLVPSQTELLSDFQLTDQVVGITKFCVHPSDWFEKKTRVGGTKSLKLDIIHSLQPDLIIANREENVKDQVNELAKYYPVWISDPKNLEDALNMITGIGEITNSAQQAKEMTERIRCSFSQLSPCTPLLRAAYLIWRDPYMSVGKETFINDMLKRCGLENVFENRERYPAITIEQLQKVNCQLLLLSSEPFPFKEKHVAELKLLLPGTNILLADGEMFSWYGSRMLFAPAYFQQLLKLTASTS